MSLWQEPSRGRHHYAKALSKDNTVVWINKRYENSKNSPNKIGVEYINKNLIVLHTGKSFFSNKIDEYLNLNNLFRLFLIKKILLKSYKPDLIWIYDYKGIRIAKYFNKKAKVLYFCNDNFGNKVYHYYELKLAKIVQYIFCTDLKLVNKFKLINNRTYFIPHGIWMDKKDISIFRKKYTPKIVGYVGTFNDTLDINFFNQILINTNYDLYLAGPIFDCDYNKSILFKNLFQNNRVKYFGILSNQSDITKFIQNFDICLLPYLNTFDGFALKFFDYLYSGKIIVATEYNFIWPKEFLKFVHLYKKEFNLQVFLDSIYSSWNFCKYSNQKKLASNSSWFDRIIEISKYLYN